MFVFVQWRIFWWIKLSLSDVIFSQKGSNGDAKIQFFGRDYNFTPTLCAKLPLWAEINFESILRHSVFHHCYERAMNKQVDFTLNLSGATSFWASTSVWASTSIWESPLNTKKLHFSTYFYISLIEPLISLMKKVWIDIFTAFFINFDHVNICASMR